MNRKLPIVVGIDLGTTNSVMSVFLEDGPKLVPDKLSKNIIPSVVHFRGDNVFVGHAAKYKWTKSSTIYQVKRLIGRKMEEVEEAGIANHLPFPIKKDAQGHACIGIREDSGLRLVSPQEVSSYVLAELKKAGEKFLAEHFKIPSVCINKVMITVPAYFGDLQRKCTMDAGKLAGFEFVKTINEPTAAAVAYGYFCPFPDKQRVLVYDLGGGTFDVTVMEIKKDYYEVLFTHGDTLLGGNDFDNLMVNKCLTQFWEENPEAGEVSKKDRVRLKMECEKIKKQLSKASISQATLKIKICRRKFEFSKTFLQEEFEELIDPWLEKANGIVNKVLDAVGLKHTQIDKVLLVGGSTYIPLVKRKLAALFGLDRLGHEINPDESVAVGAGIYAGVESEYEFSKLRNLMISDVTPLSIGTDIKGGLYSVIIPRSTTVPCERSKVYYTTKDGQTSMSIDIFEGDFRLYKQNHKIQIFTLTDLPALPKGEVQVKVTLELDENSTLTLTAKCLVSRKKQRIQINFKERRLSKAEIEKFQLKSLHAKGTKKLQREKAQVIEYLDALIKEVKFTLADQDMTPFIQKPEKKLLKAEVQKVKEWRAQNPEASLFDIEQKKKRLDQAWKQIWKKVEGRYKEFHKVSSTFTDLSDLED